MMKTSAEGKGNLSGLLLNELNGHADRQRLKLPFRNEGRKPK